MCLPIVVSCFARTWSCTDGDRRSILIYSTDPCKTPGDNNGTDARGDYNAADADDDDDDDNQQQGGWGSASRVEVSDDCVPSSFGVGMMFLTVVARGERDASFTLVASLVGKVGSKEEVDGTVGRGFLHTKIHFCVFASLSGYVECFVRRGGAYIK